MLQRLNGLAVRNFDFHVELPLNEKILLPTASITRGDYYDMVPRLL